MNGKRLGRRTKFARWLDAVGQTARAFATEQRLDPQPVYYLAGIQPSRPVKSVSFRVLALVSAVTGISERVLAGDALVAAKNPRMPDAKRGPPFRKPRPEAAE